MVGKFLIYGLVDPRDGRLRYVGRSSSGLSRPRRHWKDPETLNDGLHVHNWCKQIVESGFEPRVEILEKFPGTGDPDEWLNERERFWIRIKREEGCDLTNLTDGGEGCFNPCDETREKMRRAKLGRPRKPFSEESKRKMSEAKKGNKNGSGNKGKKRTPEQRALISKKTSEAMVKWWNPGMFQGE